MTDIASVSNGSDPRCLGRVRVQTDPFSKTRFGSSLDPNRNFGSGPPSFLDPQKKCGPMFGSKNGSKFQNPIIDFLSTKLIEITIIPSGYC